MLVVFWVKPAIGVAAAVALVTWYLRWLNRWFEQHAEAEFRIKELEIDLDRASWLVETALEWRETRETPFPNKLMDALTRNLFVPGRQPHKEDEQPVDLLASAILGRASKLRLNVQGNELEFNSKALKEAGRN